MRTDRVASDFYTSYYSGTTKYLRKDRHRDENHHPRNSRFWRVADKVCQIKGAKQRVLDIGCGEGTLCNELKIAGWPIVMGQDISRSRVERARSRFPEIEFFEGNIRELPLQPNQLDMAILDNVIEHLPNPTEIPRAVCPLLRDDGVFVVITPNMQSGHFRLLGRYWTPELAPHAHIYLFTESSLCRLLESVGFQVLSSGSFQLPIRLKGLLDFRGLGNPPIFIKEKCWRLLQEAGTLWGRVQKSGPMIFAVACRQNIEASSI